MGKAKSGNSNVLKVVSIVAAIVVAVGIIAVFVAPLIPVRKVDESAYKKLDNNDVYERAYNIYGVQIYKDRDKALAQFKADYNAALVYLDEKLGLGEFNTSYDMLSQYGENGWQYTFSADERRELGEEKVNELKQKMAGISAFCDMYENTNWRVIRTSYEQRVCKRSDNTAFNALCYWYYCSCAYILRTSGTASYETDISGGNVRIISGCVNNI